MKAANVYANDNLDDFPIVLPPRNSTVTFAGGLPAAPNADTVIQGYYDGEVARGNMSANLWLLVLKGYTDSKTFVCQSDVVGKPAASVQAGNHFNNFQGVENISYAAAVPWNAAGQKQGFWKSIVDATTPIIADLGPRNGENTSNGIVNVTSPQKVPALWNSRIHGGEGQTIGWSDGHTSFELRPDIGLLHDNIWTNNGDAGPSPTGRAPFYGRGTQTGAASRPIAEYFNGGSAQFWDIYMAPSRGVDGKTY
jgi:hypothetical protein